MKTKDYLIKGIGSHTVVFDAQSPYKAVEIAKKRGIKHITEIIEIEEEDITQPFIEKAFYSMNDVQRLEIKRLLQNK